MASLQQLGHNLAFALSLFCCHQNANSRNNESTSSYSSTFRAPLSERIKQGIFCDASASAHTLLGMSQRPIRQCTLTHLYDCLLIQRVFWRSKPLLPYNVFVLRSLETRLLRL
jgi:hypothetical protein